jgi:hypothetical protein
MGMRAREAKSSLKPWPDSQIQSHDGVSLFRDLPAGIAQRSRHQAARLLCRLTSGFGRHCAWMSMVTLICHCASCS